MPRNVQLFKRIQFKSEKDRRRIDQRILDGVRLFGDTDWGSIAKYVGYGTTGVNCLLEYSVNIRDSIEQFDSSLFEMHKRTTMRVGKVFRRKNGACIWNMVMDARLHDAVSAQGNGDYISWRKVCKYIGGGVTSADCQRRWCKVAEPAGGPYKHGEWERNEVKLLQLLRECGHGWKSISARLQRSDRDCQNLLACPWRHTAEDNLCLLDAPPGKVRSHTRRVASLKRAATKTKKPPPDRLISTPHPAATPPATREPPYKRVGRDPHSTLVMVTRSLSRLTQERAATADGNGAEVVDVDANDGVADETSDSDDAYSQSDEDSEWAV